MNIVPIGFAAPELSDMTEPVGGSAYGAGSMSKGDGSRAVSEKEKSVARFQGEQRQSVNARKSLTLFTCRQTLWQDCSPVYERSFSISRVAENLKGIVGY